jgi:GAF domain-containing protein
VVHPDGIDTPTATDDVLRKIDALQHEIGEGPCVTALRQTDVVIANDLSADERWPHWGSVIADELDIHSCLNFRLFTTGANLGTVNLYGRRRHAFSHEDVLDGNALAAHVAVALAGSLREDNMAVAMMTRTRIGQAQGILMERFGIDADRAFEVLRRVSNQENRKVHDIAFELIETRETPGTA